MIALCANGYGVIDVFISQDYVMKIIYHTLFCWSTSLLFISMRVNITVKRSSFLSIGIL